MGNGWLTWAKCGPWWGRGKKSAYTSPFTSSLDWWWTNYPPHRQLRRFKLAGGHSEATPDINLLPAPFGETILGVAIFWLFLDSLTQTLSCWNMVWNPRGHNWWFNFRSFLLPPQPSPWSLFQTYNIKNQKGQEYTYKTLLEEMASVHSGICIWFIRVFFAGFYLNMDAARFLNGYQSISDRQGMSRTKILFLFRLPGSQNRSAVVCVVAAVALAVGAIAGYASQTASSSLYAPVNKVDLVFSFPFFLVAFWCFLDWIFFFLQSQFLNLFLPDS